MIKRIQIDDKLASLARHTNTNHHVLFNYLLSDPIDMPRDKQGTRFESILFLPFCMIARTHERATATNLKVAQTQRHGPTTVFATIHNLFMRQCSQKRGQVIQDQRYC
jgi:predicted O-linked N-acetylglucosamine transferase (SPINDLY family)